MLESGGPNSLLGEFDLLWTDSHSRATRSCLPRDATECCADTATKVHDMQSLGGRSELQNTLAYEFVDVSHCFGTSTSSYSPDRAVDCPFCPLAETK
jgi:hypothetical protein